MSDKTILKKSDKNLTREERYHIIDDYIYSGLTNEAIAQKNKTTKANVELIITRHSKALQNVRETKALVLSQDSSSYKQFAANVLDPEKINESFLEKLSEPDSLVLTDNEVVFCELFNYDGDDVRALEESNLNVGLRKAKDPKDREEYKQSLKLRSFYLRRKPNVAAYLQKIQADKIKTIVDGKGFIQAQLLSVIEKVQNSTGERAAMTHLKAISELGRTFAAFEDRLTVDGLDGDSAIERILKKAQEARCEVIDQDEEADV